VILPVAAIEYCRQCRWLLRAAWMAQELLMTFEDDLGGVTLVPGTDGIFVVRIGDSVSGRERKKVGSRKSPN
jgi:selenoprotein W-related protein